MEAEGFCFERNWPLPASARLQDARYRSSDEFSRIRMEPSTLEIVFRKIALLDSVAIKVLRLGLIVVLLWIGGLKFANYEADSIVPLVANSPFMHFLYAHPAPEYRAHMNREGEYVPEHRQWHESNNTYPVSHALGFVILILGVLIALHKPFPQLATLGSALLILMTFITLSFLITTPEAWVPDAGDITHGFPYLSGVGRLIIKDCVILGAAFVTMVDSAKAYLRHREIWR